MDAPYFHQEEFLAFHPVNRLNKSPQLQTLQSEVKQKLLYLHTIIRPNLCLYNLDLHPHWQDDLIVSSHSPIGHPNETITHWQLTYGKSNSQLKSTLRSFAYLEVDQRTFWQSPLVFIRVNYAGVHVGLALGEKAWLESTNLRNKVQYSQINQRSFLQLLSDLFVFGFRMKDTFDAAGLGKEATPAQVLQLARAFQDTNGQLYVSKVYAPDDPRLYTGRITMELIAQIRLLYPLYRFVSWRPDNHYLD